MRRHRRTITAFLAGTALGLTVAVTGVASGAPADPSGTTVLQQKLSALLADPSLSGATVGLTVRDLTSGATLYRAKGSTRLLPASNVKLLTSAAALDVLGPGYRFATQVLTTGARHGATLDGALHLRGTGDPTIRYADYDALAASVARSGVRTVRGLDVDDSFFDDVPLAPFWSWDDEPYYYSAQTSALTVAPNSDGDAGTLLVDVHPGRRAGDRPTITMTPPNHYLRVHDTATTGAAGSTSTVSMVRERGRNVLDVTGSIPLGADPYEDQPTVERPTFLVAQLFRHLLARHGVRVLGGTRDTVTPAGATAVAEHRSITLAALLTPWLKLSNNMMAEAVTKAMGRKVSGEGTWSAGTAAITAKLKRLGVDTSTIQLFDGSGLGRADYAPTDQLITLLAAARSEPWFPTWYAALPIAGNPDRLVGGTLRNRMKGTAAAGNVHAKTGSMTGVSALSGYVTDAAGHRLAFSMISNNFVADGVTSVEDAVAETLASYDGTSAATVRVAGTQPTGPTRSTSAGRRGGPRDGAQLECTWSGAC